MSSGTAHFPNLEPGHHVEGAEQAAKRRAGQAEFETSSLWTIQKRDRYSWDGREVRTEGVSPGDYMIVCDVDKPSAVKMREEQYPQARSRISEPVHYEAFAIAEGEVRLSDNMRAATDRIAVYRAVRRGSTLIWVVQDPPPRGVRRRL